MGTQGRDTGTQRRRWLGLAVAVIVVAAITAPLVVLNSHKTAVLLGDSLTDESSTTISSFLAVRGYSVHPEAIPGSGLLDTEVHWLARGRQYIAEYDPSVVTVEFIGDFGYLGAPPGVQINTPTFYRDWARVAQRLEDILTSRGAQVYWVVGPPVAVPSIQTTITHLDRIYGQLHAPNTASGRPPLINVTPALTGHTGRYTEYLPGQGGTPAEVREPDGIHLTIYGIVLRACDHRRDPLGARLGRRGCGTPSSCAAGVVSPRSRLAFLPMRRLVAPISNCKYEGCSYTNVAIGKGRDLPVWIPQSGYRAELPSRSGQNLRRVLSMPEGNE